jgi:chromosome condensin MukBEF ATPase and DNA-binding subunit MukB
MKYYRCYLLTDDDHIASARILKCADDEDAKRQCRHVIATNGRFPAAEVWDGARRLYRHPEDPKNAARKQRRRKGDARDQDQAIADALSAQIAADRRRRLEADAVKAAQLRERRLEKEAEMSEIGTARGT